MAFAASVVERIRLVARFQPHDTSTARGRSHERYRRMTLSTAAALGARAIAMLTSLVSVPLTFRYLGAEQYGLWMVLLSFIAAMGFADLGIGNGVMNAVSEAYGKDDRDLARQYVASGLALMLGVASVLALAGAIAYPFIPWLRVFNVKSAAVAAEGARAFLVLFCWFVVNIPLDVVTRAQAGMQRAYWSQTVNACGNILSLLGLIAVIELRGSLAWLVFASTAGIVVATVLNGWILFRTCPWMFPSWRDFRGTAAGKIFRLGLLFFVLQCALTLAFTSDNIVIAQVLGAAAVAVYAVPQKLFSVVSMLINMGMTPMWPAYTEAATRGDVVWIRKAFRNSLCLIMAIVVPLCAGLALCGPWIIRIAVSKALYVPPSLFWALAAWGVIVALTAPVSMMFNGLGVLKPQCLIAIIASLANLALSIFLTKHLGVIGVCLGSVITQVLIVLPSYAYLIRSVFRKMSAHSMTLNPVGTASI